jgi:zinc transport system ATP-binding protein
MKLVSVENLSVRYGANTVLREVHLDIEQGEIVTVVGPNGSGKTSLFKAIIGAIQPAQGYVQLKPGLKIGYVPQRLNFDATLPITVERFMRLTGNVKGKSCISALETAGVPELLKCQMSKLSGGQFQRVLLAAALLKHPEILLLDEATQGLDQPGSAAFYRKIESVRRDTGCAVLMISHDLHVVMSAADRVICLNGHVCCAGTPAAVASTPEYKELFGAGTDGALALYRHDHDHVHHPSINSHEVAE